VNPHGGGVDAWLIEPIDALMGRIPVAAGVEPQSAQGRRQISRRRPGGDGLFEGLKR
jgi:hypothetical protein